MKQKKTTWFKFWLTPQDKQLLEEEASLSNVSVAAFLRACIHYFAKEENHEKLFAEKKGRKVLSGVKYELNRYGNNLNQIAHKLNRNRYGFTNDEIKSMKSELIKINDGINTIKSKIERLEGQLVGK